MLGLSPRLRFAAAVVLAGLGAGAVGLLLTLLLQAVQYLAFGEVRSDIIVGVEHAARLRRLLAPTIGAIGCGLVWMRLRRTPLPTAEHALDDGGKRLPLGRTTVDAVAQIVIVGTGSSVGREQAPRQVAAAVADWLSDTFALDPSRRRLLVASAAGAGLAAVYNVPLAGAVFCWEVIGLGVRRVENIVTALVVSLIATLVTWGTLGDAPTYAWIPTELDPSLWLWALALAPLCAVVGVGFRSATGWVLRHQPAPTWRLPVFVTLAAATEGLASWWWPELPGNGKGIVQVALTGAGGLGLWVVLLALKPLATLLCLNSGAAGGTLTPAMALGAALGAVGVRLVGLVGIDLPMAAVALVAAAGVLAVTQRAPWFAALFGWELVHPPLELVGPLVIVALGAHLIVRAVAANRRPA